MIRPTSERILEQMKKKSIEQALKRSTERASKRTIGQVDGKLSFWKRGRKRARGQENSREEPKIVPENAVAWESDHGKQYSLTDVPIDCVGVIVRYMTTRDWIQFSYTDKQYNGLKFDPTLMVMKKRTVHPYARIKRIEAGLKASVGTLFNVDFAGNEKVRHETFQYLEGTIVKLDISSCSHPSIRNNTFYYLRDTIKSLYMNGCDLPLTSLTGEAFVHLKGIYELEMMGFRRIDDSHLSHLAGIQSLDMSYSRINDAGLEHLRGIRRLTISCCTADLVSDVGLSFIKENITLLRMRSLLLRGVTESGFDGMDELVHLDISGCRSEAISDKMFSNLGDKIRFIEMNYCRKCPITDMAFMYLKGKIKRLSIRGCDQPAITGRTIVELKDTLELVVFGYGNNEETCNTLNKAYPTNDETHDE